MCIHIYVFKLVLCKGQGQTLRRALGAGEWTVATDSYSQFCYCELEVELQTYSCLAVSSTLSPSEAAPPAPAPAFLQGGGISLFYGFYLPIPFSLTAGTSSCETEVLTAVLIKVRVFWDITPCRLINSCLLVLGPLDPEDKGSSIIRNIGKYLYLFIFI